MSTIGIVNENGTLIAKLSDDKKIIINRVDKFGNKHIEVLYNQPFDVQYAFVLIRLYELSRNYLMLEEHMILK